LREPGRNPLRNLQEKLEAVGVAYGFSSDDEALAQLLALNQSIAEEERGGVTSRRPGNEGLANTKRTWPDPLRSVRPV